MSNVSKPSFPASSSKSWNKTGAREGGSWLRRTVSALLLNGACIGLLVIDSGCGDEPNPTEPEPQELTGRLLDGSNQPIAGAGIGFRFAWTAPVPIEGRVADDRTDGGRSELLPPSPNPIDETGFFEYVTAVEEKVRLTLVDHRFLVVRTLVDERQDAGSHRLFWPGDDDHGAPVPNGLYLARLELGLDDNASIFEQRVLVHSLDLERQREAPFSHTDADGTFSVPWPVIPVGRDFLATDIAGEVQGRSTVLPSVQFCATWSNGDSLLVECFEEELAVFPEDELRLVVGR